MFASLHMPVFFPGNVQEVVDLGLHAYACSRASGLWSGFKIITNVADAVGTIAVAPDRVSPVLPDLRYEHEPTGIRILKLGMVWPLEPDIAREFASGLGEVLVVEEKGPFLETLLKETLYGVQGAPLVHGKRDERGERLLPVELDLDADVIARAVAARLGRKIQLDSVEAYIRRLDSIENRGRELPMMAGGGAQRTPFFCSGCPHNSSIKAPEGTLVGAGIGCHTMVLLNPEGKGEITGITQMGGEGAQWIGMAPFTDRDHFVQNLGDGTFHHSGSLAVRAAVAAGVNITYKLFYNDAVAMTGGQDVEGALPVPEITRALEA